MSSLKLISLLSFLLGSFSQSIVQSIKWEDHDLSIYKTRITVDSSFWNKKVLVTTENLLNGNVVNSSTLDGDSLYSTVIWNSFADYKIETTTYYETGEVTSLGLRKFDFKGRLTEEKNIHQTFQYNLDQKLTSFDTSTYYLTLYDYDKDLVLSKEHYFFWEGDGSLQSTEYYKYDIQNRLIETTIFDESTIIGSFKRNSDVFDTMKIIPPGNFTTHLIQYQKDTTYHFFHEGNGQKELSHYDLMDKQGRKKRSISIASDLSENVFDDYKYNKRGHLTHSKTTIIDLNKINYDLSFVDEVQIVYYDYGLPKNRIEYSDGQAVSNKTFTYSK